MYKRAHCVVVLLAAILTLSMGSFAILAVSPQPVNYTENPEVTLEDILTMLGKINATITKTSGDLGKIDATITKISGDVAATKTAVGTLASAVSLETVLLQAGKVRDSVDKLRVSTDTAINYGLGALALSVINLIVLLAVAARVFRKT